MAVIQKMDPEIKVRWVEALRSGVFTQGRGSLRRDDDGDGTDVRHCCLGVLCTLAEADGVIERHEWQNDSLLPQAVMDWAGVRTNDPTIAVNTTDGTIERRVAGSTANDQGVEFAEIATAISTNL